MFRSMQSNHLDVCLIQAIPEQCRENSTIIFHPITNWITILHQLNNAILLWFNYLLLDIDISSGKIEKPEKIEKISENHGLEEFYKFVVCFILQPKIDLGRIQRIYKFFLPTNIV